MDFPRSEERSDEEALFLFEIRREDS